MIRFIARYDLYQVLSWSGTQTPPVVRLIATTKPWLGKVFDADGERGTKLLTAAFVALSSVLFRGCCGFRPAGEDAFSGFPSRTHAAGPA